MFALALVLTPVALLALATTRRGALVVTGLTLTFRLESEPAEILEPAWTLDAEDATAEANVGARDDVNLCMIVF